MRFSNCVTPLVHSNLNIIAGAIYPVIKVDSCVALIGRLFPQTGSLDLSTRQRRTAPFRSFLWIAPLTTTKAQTGNMFLRSLFVDATLHAIALPSICRTSRSAYWLTVLITTSRFSFTLLFLSLNDCRALEVFFDTMHQGMCAVCTWW